MKPTHAKPQLYAYYFLQLKEIAKEFGYNLVVHGSMARDLDLVAIPWVDDPKDEMELIHALHKHITGHVAAEGHEKEIYMFSKLPGGRHSYVINVNRGPKFSMEDPQYYIDISVTPKGSSQPLSSPQ
jgi:hypothetical protein